MMRRSGGAILLALALLAIHTLQVWGYTGVFWGDIGRWSHEVERFALGELPYRDFQWHYPPLGLWVEGTLARVLGTDRLPLSLITTALAAALVATFTVYARDVLGRPDAAVMTIALVLALAFAQRVGAPLPLGLYSPAALVGAVCIANAARFFARHRVDPSPHDAEWMALWAALAVLSKQDFWIPAAFLVGAMTLLTRRPGAIVVSGGVTLLGVAAIVVTAGAGVLLPLAGGFGHAQLAGGQGFPSWERIAVDLFALSLVSGGVFLVASVAARRLMVGPLLGAAVLAAVTGGLHMAASMRTVLPDPGSLLTPTQEAMSYHLREGQPLLRPALGWLRRRVSQTPIPVSLAPALLLLTAYHWKRLPDTRRVTVALLLGLAIALRARRAFEGTEWFEFLLSLPILVASVELLLSLRPEVPLRRVRLGMVGALALLAAWGFVAYGRGWGTMRVNPQVTTTRRGDVRWIAPQARDYLGVMAALDSLDPARQRPLLAFGFTGGWNYFTERHNPYPFTQDFFFSAFDADSVLSLPRPKGLFLIDNPALANGSFGAATFDVSRWEQPRVPAPYDTFDRPRFDRLRQGCAHVPVDRTMFVVYACP